MLSTETPSSDPPSHQTHISSSSSSSSSKHAHPHFPTFSIRDYVFTARKDHIENNWPFSQHYLQLFSKHEIKSILPPFESPDSVRKQCRSKGQCEFSNKAAVVEVVDHSSVEKRFPSQEPLLLQEHERLKLQSRLSRLVIDDGESERESTPSNGQLPCSSQEDSLFESPLDLHSSQLRSAPQRKDSTIEPSGRKCKLTVKLGLMSDQTHSEDIASNITTISDSMASKVCPVCKTFSSTSNTTLNAHIDQCLAAEPTPKCIRDRDDVKLTKRDDVKLTKHMTKPTKKRSMVDIYATAKSCTLEELDKRNGSNWAGNSTLPTAEAEATADEKRPRLSDAPHEGTNDENPVYFDSRGTKIRIISKISNAPITTAGDEPNKLIKHGKESKAISFEVKKNLLLKNGQHRKGKPRSKNLCSLESNNVELSVEHETINGMDEFQHNEESSQLLKAGDGINCIESGTLRHWVCSKRTNILRRARARDSHRGVRLSPSTERNNMNCGDSSHGDSNLSGKFVSSPTTTDADTSRYESSPITDRRMDSHTKSERRLSPVSKEKVSDRNGGYFLKLPKSPGKFASSPRSKKVDVSAKSTGNPVCFAKQKKSSLSNELVTKPSFSSLKSKVNGTQSILKKPRVHRSITEMNEQLESQPLNTEQRCEYLDSSAENLRGQCHTRVTYNSTGPNDKVMPEVAAIADELSLDGVGVLPFMRGRESTRILERSNPMTAEEASRAGTDNQYLDVDATIESHVEIPLQKFNSGNNTTDNYDDLRTSADTDPVNVDAVGETFSRKAGAPISKSIKTIDSAFHNISIPVDAKSNVLQSSEEQHERCLCRTKSFMPLMQQKVGDSQLKNKASEVCRIGVDSNIRSEVSSRFVAICSSKCPSAKCGNDLPYIPAPPDSVSPTLRNGSSKDHPENSSLTSSKMLFPQNEHMVADRGSSESPVSLTSSISHPTKPRSGLVKFLNPESCTRPLEIQDKHVLGFWGGLTEPIVKDTASLQFVYGTMGAERFDIHGENMKTATISPSQEPVIYSGPPCCCLWKRNLAADAPENYQDLQLLKQCTGESSMNAALEKQMECNMNTGPEILAKPDCLVFSRNSHIMASNCESAGGSVSTHFSSQDVQSTPNSVVRLMGKNLIVASKDEDAFVKLKQPTPVSSNACTSAMCLNLLRCSPGALSNQDCVTSHYEIPEASVVSSQDSCTPRPHPHFFSDDLSKSFTNRSCSRLDQRQSVVGNGNNVYAGEVDSSLIYHGLKSRTDLPIDRKKLLNRLDSFPYEVEDDVAPLHLQHLNHVSAVQKIGIPAKEVIVIEDSPENEVEINRFQPKYVQGLKENQSSHVSVVPPSSTYRSMPQNAFCYRTSNPFSQVEPLLGTKRSFPVLHHGEASRSPSKWGARDPFTSKIYQFPSLS